MKAGRLQGGDDSIPPRPPAPVCWAQGAAVGDTQVWTTPVLRPPQGPRTARSQPRPQGLRGLSPAGPGLSGTVRALKMSEPLMAYEWRKGRPADEAPTTRLLAHLAARALLLPCGTRTPRAYASWSRSHSFEKQRARSAKQEMERQKETRRLRADDPHTRLGIPKSSPPSKAPRLERKRHLVREFVFKERRKNPATYLSTLRCNRERRLQTNP